MSCPFHRKTVKRQNIEYIKAYYLNTTKKNEGIQRDCLVGKTKNKNELLVVRNNE